MLAAAVFAAGSAMAQFDPMQPIPADKEVRTGRLDNGLTYYIRHNEKPKGQADFYILHNVGAIQEEDDQQGLAHFLEHMAFNGTKNLPGKQLIEYLETVGVKFGYNLNAGTSWDQTVYNISDVPTSRQGIIDSAMLILHDWSHFIALRPEEIDSERGVIMEELRTRDGASWRSTMKLLQALGKGTRYEHRNLIGYLDGLKSFEHDALERFYKKWYRPDYQAIVIVGDLDAEATEARLKSLMADIPAPAADAAQKEVIVVPDNEEPIVSIYTDPEMQGSRVQLFIKRPAIPTQMNDKVAWEVVNVIESFLTTMENARLQEIAMQPDAPFLGAGMGSGDVIGIIPTLNATAFTAMTQDGKLAEGFEALYTEMEKIRRHGFTQSEFERAQENLMRQVERTYANRNDRTNEQFVNIYLENYRKNEPMPDAETEWKLDSMLIKMLNVETVNAFAKETIQPTNQVIVITAPEKEGIANPTEEEILAIREKVTTQFNAGVPQRRLRIDKEQALASGVDLGVLYGDLTTLLGGAYVNNFSRFGKLYQTYIQAAPAYRMDKRSLDSYYVASSSGESVPVSSLVEVVDTVGVEYVSQFNLYRSIGLTVTPAARTSTTTVMQDITRTAAQVLPDDVGTAWSGTSFQEANASKTGGLVYLLALVFVFLALAALYESWGLPLAILMSVPVAVLGAVLFIGVSHLLNAFYVNDIYMQISLVMLIGLAAKNAILVVEYADRLFNEQGASLMDAAIGAAKLRVRPIIMTAFAFILGVMPLIFASGVYATARNIMGVALVGGMLFATLLGIFVYPALYYFVGRIGGFERRRERKKQEQS